MFIFRKSFSDSNEDKKYKDKLSIFERIPISMRKAMMSKSWNKDVADHMDYLLGDESKEKGYKRMRNIHTAASAGALALAGSVFGPAGAVAGAGAGAVLGRYVTPFVTKHLSSKFAKVRALGELESDRRRVASGEMSYKDYYKKYHKFEKD